MSSGKLLQIDGTATEKALSPRALTAGITDQQLQKKTPQFDSIFQCSICSKKAKKQRYCLGTNMLHMFKQQTVLGNRFHNKAHQHMLNLRLGFSANHLEQKAVKPTSAMLQPLQHHSTYRSVLCKVVWCGRHTAKMCFLAKLFPTFLELGSSFTCTM